MRTTFSIQYYCRPSKANRNGEAPIECSIIINGERVMLNLPMRADPKEFAKKRQPKEIADYVSIQRVRMKEIVNQLMDHGIPVTAENLRKYLRTGGVQAYKVKDLFKDFLAIQSKRVDVDITLAVYWKYDLAKRRFFEVVDPETECGHINNNMIKEVVTYIYKKYDASTAAGYCTRIKAVIKHGMDNGHIKNNPWAGIKLSKGFKPIEMLSDDDFEQIRQKTFGIDRIDKVKDMFVFCCGSGLAYIDLKELTPEDFQTINGHLCIVKNRHKTNNTYVSVLMPWAVEIADKYQRDFRGVVLSNQRSNAYLKEIADICKVKSVKSLHTHLGRHFYLNKLLNSGVRPETVAKAAGHSNYKVLMKHYARVEEQTTVNEIAKIL
jgi:integrase